MRDFYLLLETIGKHLLPTGVIVNRFKLPLIVEPLLALIKKNWQATVHIYSLKSIHWNTK